MRGWRRFSRLVITLATLALLAGCGLTQTQRLPDPPDMARDQTLKLMLPVDDGGASYEAALDPAVAVYPNAFAFSGTIQPTTLLYDTLVTLDRNEQIEPWAAQSWDISADGLTYSFHLRPNQRFSDGKPVKASDYAWSIDRLANPCLGLFTDTYSGGLRDNPLFLFTALKDAQAFHNERCDDDGRPVGALSSLIGDAVIPNDSAQTLTLRLARPTGYFLRALTMPLVSVIERSVVTGDNLGADQFWIWRLADGKTGQGGSGMFYLASMARGPRNTPTALTLKPNPYWWGLSVGKKPYFSEIDLMDTAPSAAFDTFTNDPNIAYGGVISSELLSQRTADLVTQPYYHEQPALATAALVFNPTVAPFDDLNARKAFCLAINREQLQHAEESYHVDDSQGFYAVGPEGRLLWQGSLIPTWHIVPEGMDGYNPRLIGLDGAPVSGNTTLARQYWQAYLAAHHGVAPAITMDVNVGDARIDMAVTQSWRDILGVRATLTAARMQAGPVVTSENQWIDIATSMDSADPRDAFAWGYSVTAGANQAEQVALAPFGSATPQADALLKHADGLSDMRQRIPLYQRAEQLLIDNATVCPLYQPKISYALRPWVKGGFVEDARGVFPNDAWVTGYIAKH